MQLERYGLHDRQSHVTPPCRSFLGSIEDDGVSEPLLYSSDKDESKAEEEEDEDVEDDESGDDNDAGDDTNDAQPSVADGMYPNIIRFLFECQWIIFSRC